MTQNPINPKTGRKYTTKHVQYLEMKESDSTELARLQSGGMPKVYDEIVHVGRPTVYDEEIVTEILARLEAGETLKAICRSDPIRYPPDSTIRHWVYDDVQGLLSRYTRARDLGLDARAEAIFDIVDRDANDLGSVARDRLRVDTAKWYLGKMAPRRYGDRLDVTSGGEKLSITISKDDLDE